MSPTRHALLLGLRADRDMTERSRNRWPELCICNHDERDHAKGTGRCRSVDSYGFPCECLSFERDASDDDSDDADDNGETEAEAVAKAAQSIMRSRW